MNTIKLIHVHDNSTITTIVNINLLSGLDVTFNLSDLILSDKQIYDSFMDNVISLNLSDYINSFIDDKNTIIHIDVKEWHEHGGILIPEHELIYTEFINMLDRIV